MIAVELAAALGGDLGFETLEDVAAAAGTGGDAVSGDGSVLAPSTNAGAMPGTPEIPVPALDAYSLRLVAGRMLYDHGSAVAASPSLANLVKPVVMRANPRDLDRLGVTTGSQVRVSGSRASFNVTVANRPRRARRLGVAAAQRRRRRRPRAHRLQWPGHRHPDREPLMNVLALDPIFENGVDFWVVLIVIIKTVVTFAVLMVAVLFMVWYERKLISDMQNRIGPAKAGGRFGILQSLADGIKLFFKEDLLPDRADKRVFRLAPYLSAVPAFLSFAIVPIGGVVTIGTHTTTLQLADPPVGILFLLAMSGISVYGVMLAGWSSGSKYPLLGSVRASAQMVSYEAALGLSIATVVLLAGSLSTTAIVANQAGEGPGGFLPAWNIIRLGVVPFVIFLIAATAELNRPPFDLVEAEQELVGGFHTEYSSIRFALFFLAEFMNTVTMSAVVVTLFLGGPSGPLLGVLPDWLWPIIWFTTKLMVFLSVQVWFRATLPRLRYDQLMDMGWKLLIPLSLFWLLVIAAVRVESWYAGVAIPVGLLLALLLSRSMQVGRARVDEKVGQ